MNWKPVIVTLLVFGLGAVAGGMVATTMVHRKVEQARLQQLPAAVTADREFPKRIGAFIDKEMSLAPAQKGQLKKLVDQYSRDQESLRQDLRRRSRRMFAEFEKNLTTVLTPEQVKQYKENSRRRQQFFLQFRERRTSGEKPGEKAGEKSSPAPQRNAAPAPAVVPADVPASPEPAAP